MSRPSVKERRTLAAGILVLLSVYVEDGRQWSDEIRSEVAVLLLELRDILAAE